MTKPNIIFTHGAGASIESDVLNLFHTSLIKYDFSAIGFNFPYMQKAIELKKRRPPERVDKLKIQLAEKIQSQENTSIIAGKSMGGRVATLLVADREFDHLDIKHVFVWGYPFYAPKKDHPRIDHFKDINAQVHIFQGTRDSFGKPEQINALDLPKNIHIHWVDGANHDFAILKKLEKSTSQTIDEICEKMREIVKVASILSE